MQEVNGVEAGLMQDAQRFFVLTQTDNLWKEHLQAIKFVQQVRTAGCFTLLQALAPMHYFPKLRKGTSLSFSLVLSAVWYGFAMPATAMN